MCKAQCPQIEAIARKQVVLSCVVNFLAEVWSQVKCWLIQDSSEGRVLGRAQGHEYLKLSGRNSRLSFLIWWVCPECSHVTGWPGAKGTLPVLQDCFPAGHFVMMSDVRREWDLAGQSLQKVQFDVQTHATKGIPYTRIFCCVDVCMYSLHSPPSFFWYGSLLIFISILTH